MFLKAINMKESIFGADDIHFAVSLSLLAHLYTFEMEVNHEKAENHYLHSIKIKRNLFGPCHSGLEWDYKGLIQVKKILSMKSYRI